jgi:hypothetical protein
MISGNVEIGNLLKRLRKVPEEAPRIIKKAIDADARGFVRDIVNLTPPSQGKANIESKKRGEGRVEADVRKAYGTPSDLWRLIRDKEGEGTAGQFWSYVKLNQWKKANDISRRIVGREFSPFDGGAEHKRRRNPRTGRVIGGEQPKHKTVFLNTFQLRKLKGYTKKQQKNVGLLAGGFVRAAEELRVKLPQWVTRHKLRLGTITKSETRRGYSITIANTARYAKGADLPRQMRFILQSTKRKKRIANVIKYEIAAVLKKQRLT